MKVRQYDSDPRVLLTIGAIILALVLGYAAHWIYRYIHCGTGEYCTCPETYGGGCE